MPMSSWRKGDTLLWKISSFMRRGGRRGPEKDRYTESLCVGGEEDQQTTTD